MPRAAKDHATPHVRDGKGGVRPIAWYPDARQVRASGSIKASARDLGNWLRLQLNAGKFDGKQVVSARALEETHTPQVVVGLDAPLARWTRATQASYGLGWRITDYHGEPLIEHGGKREDF